MPVASCPCFPLSARSMSRFQSGFRSMRDAICMVDVESDGPIPGDYSMICLGAVLVREGLGHTELVS